MELVLGHLYPDLLNLYGDRGNILVLERRCLWRGIGLRVEPISLGESLNPDRYDLFFIGGGQDREQRLLAEDLVRTKKGALQEALAGGRPLLAVCGGYQLLGHYYRTLEGEELPGTGLLDLWTVAGGKRLIGNVAIRSPILGDATVVGFENHSGRTRLGAGLEPLGQVLSGYGNNGEDGQEGVATSSVIGTYLHGSLLPKNPVLADHLLSRAVARKYGDMPLAPLDDALEEQAHRGMLRRLGVHH